MARRRIWPTLALATLLSLASLGCAGDESPSPAKPAEPQVEAGFLDVAPRDVTLHGRQVHVEATARLFYNFRPADSSPQAKPIFVLFNGFSDDIVRSYGTGPATVEEGGSVVSNPSSLTSLANLVYIEPRQSGFSYDVVEGRSPTNADCSSDVFNEYVDAGDVLFGVLSFLAAHSDLEGPIYWIGESYGGVRIQWILSFLRGADSVAPYVDETLRDRIAHEARTSSLLAGQVLLEPWLVGKAHGDAIANVCLDPATVSAVSLEVGSPCFTQDACQCTVDAGRSLYNISYTEKRQNRRVLEGDRAHVTPDRARKLIGVPLESIDGLGAKDRSRGFKCDAPDDQTPDEAELTSLLGALPKGQSYYLGYSPLQPGKEIQANDPDWSTANFEGFAFLDNLRVVPTFVTDGLMDLVVPEKALVPALRAIVDPSRIDDSDPSRIRVAFPQGDEFIDVKSYPPAGHMITMISANAFAADLTAWIANR